MPEEVNNQNQTVSIEPTAPAIPAEPPVTAAPALAASDATDDAIPTVQSEFLPQPAPIPAPAPDASVVAPSVVLSPDLPLPASQTPVAAPPAEPPPPPVSSLSPVDRLPSAALTAQPTALGRFLNRLKEKLASRTQKRLDKIMDYARKKGSVTNDEAEKLLHVSDATVTRYLSKLVKQGKVKPTGKTKTIKYVPV